MSEKQTDSGKDRSADRRTRRPKARDGHGYPCPAGWFVNGSLVGKQGFGPKGGRSPVEHRGNLYVCTYIHIYVPPSKAWASLWEAWTSLWEARACLWEDWASFWEAWDSLYEDWDWLRSPRGCLPQSRHWQRLANLYDHDACKFQMYTLYSVKSISQP